MTSPIKLIDAVTFYKELPHQTAAWNWLQDQLQRSPQLLEQFAELYRAAPAPKPQASPSPGGVDWRTPCLAIVKEFEGCVLHAYPDPGTGGDPWTIGYGHTGPEVRPGLVWTQQQAEQTLARELPVYRSQMLEVLPMASRWNGNQQAAMTSFVYNLGAGALQGSTMRRRLMAGEDPATVVPQEFPKWVNGGGGPLPGLVRRRAAEVALFCA